MGEQQVSESGELEQLRVFTQALLRDVRALEVMLEQGLFETGVRRIGAEQEVFLVDKNWQPAPASMEILQELDDPHFTTELARFNLEFNLEPLSFERDCLTVLHKDLDSHLTVLREAAARHGTEVVLTGILPTLGKSDLELSNMSPLPRYRALNDALRRLKGDRDRPYQFRIKGPDDLIVQHDSVMLESCNTSFQLHFQVDPEDFARFYNVAQLITAPVLAAVVNSPILFGRRLWKETRIALFQQAIDTRPATSHLRQFRPRVGFGNAWIRESVLEIYREQIARFRVLLGTEIEQDPFEELKNGRVPRLGALCLHNGTVYSWNRACYGIYKGRPHLRIENRVIPAGPSTIDAVANAAFFYGLLVGAAEEYGDVASLMDFRDVRTNFLTAARGGLRTQLLWVDGEAVPVQELISDTLLPIAREGLAQAGIDAEDADRYLEVIGRRVRTGRTGAHWMLESLSGMKGVGSRGERLAAVTAGMFDRQVRGRPIHKWSLARLDESGGWKANYQRVEQFMTTDLFTVHEDDSVNLIANMMNWERIRHILVEDRNQRLVGLISYRSVLKYFGEQLASGDDFRSATAAQIMKRDPFTVSPEATSVEAMEIMRRHGIGCLPVETNGHLVGVVTERDFMTIANDLLLKSLKEDEEDQESKVRKLES